MPQSSENKTPVASLASFFHALNAMPSALFICKPDGVATITHANRRALELTGYESQSGLQDLCGTSFCDFVHPCDHETVASAFQSNSPSLSTGRIACSIIRADGRIRRVNLSIHRSHDADCGPILCVFVEDITDRVLIDEELRRSKMIIGALSEEYISIFLLHIASGTVRSYRRNDYFFTQVHSSFEEGVDLSWQTVFEPYGETFVCADDRTRFFEELSPKTIGERIRRESSYAISYRQGEGEEQRFMEISIADAALDGPFSHAILGVRDVTALAQHIRETLETQFEIEGAQALEQKTNEAKSAFLFNIS